jgi:hypothetical protein
MEAFVATSKLRDKNLILKRLYKDYVRHVEEIFLIEEGNMWGSVSVYVDKSQSPQDFLIIRRFLHQGNENVSAYMVAEDQSSIKEFSEILKLKSGCHMHLQTSIELQPTLMRTMGWLKNSYTVRYCRADSETFKPYRSDNEGLVRLTPDNIKKYQTLHSPHLIKRAETAPIYAFINEKGDVAATSGVGFLTKKSFSISFTETSPQYRNRGLAKCLTSLASEPLIDRGLVGVYCADIKNEPSLRVAHALGFVPYIDMICLLN